MNVGGRAYVDEDGNVFPGKTVDMLVEGQDVFIVSGLFFPALLFGRRISSFFLGIFFTVLVRVNFNIFLIRVHIIG